MRLKSQAKRALRAAGPRTPTASDHDHVWWLWLDADRQIRSNAGTISDMSNRYRTLAHVYAGEWTEVENLRRAGDKLGVHPETWSALVDPADAASARWYDPAELDAAVARWRDEPAGGP